MAQAKTISSTSDDSPPPGWGESGILLPEAEITCGKLSYDIEAYVDRLFLQSCSNEGNRLTYSMQGNLGNNAQSGGGGPMAAALTFAGGASLADGPLPFGEIVGAAAIIGTAVYVGIKGTNEKHVGDRPKLTTTYQPVSQNPIHSPRGGIDPENPNWLGYAKWLGAAKLLYDAYDNSKLDNTNNNLNFNFVQPAVRDNTYVGPLRH